MQKQMCQTTRYSLLRWTSTDLPNTGAYHMTSSPHYSQSNSEAERASEISQRNPSTQKPSPWLVALLRHTVPFIRNEPKRRLPETIARTVDADILQIHHRRSTTIVLDIRFRITHSCEQGRKVLVGDSTVCSQIVHCSTHGVGAET